MSSLASNAAGDQGFVGFTQETVGTAEDVVKFWMRQLYLKLIKPRDLRNHYKKLLAAATSFQQWSAAAAMLDHLDGKEDWKMDPVSPDYDYTLLIDRFAQLKRAREVGDYSSCIFLLRTSLNRNLGDMGNPKLYARAHVGTKQLIDDFIDEVLKHLNLICDTELDDFQSNEKYEFFYNCQRAFGRTALLLSGGATLGLAHIGVVKTLFENKLLPRIISGSSVGSMIAGAICTHTDDQLPELLLGKNLNLDVFERPGEHRNWFLRIARMIKFGVVFDADVFVEAIRQNVGGYSFIEAYNLTRRILNITVSSSTPFEMPRLLNYTTAPNVLIYSAVAASCALPGMYRSAPLLAKDENGKIMPWNPSGHRWIDGSVENDLPMARISEMYNVNHFIVSQVNPHVIPLMPSSLDPPFLTKLAAKGASLMQAELQHRLNQLRDLEIRNSLIDKMESILMQKYYGDITIVPQIPLTEYFNLVENPTPRMTHDYTVAGERAIWPQMSLIKNHLAIELCIDEIMYRLRVRPFLRRNVLSEVPGVSASSRFKPLKRNYSAVPQKTAAVIPFSFATAPRAKSGETKETSDNDSGAPSRQRPGSATHLMQYGVQPLLTRNNGNGNHTEKTLRMG